MSCNIERCDRYTGEDCGITWCPAYLPRNTSNKIVLDVNTIITGDTKNDLVAVVRCKDCIHSRLLIDNWRYCEKTYADLSGWHKRVDDDFYCADGKRKEADADEKNTQEGNSCRSKQMREKM